MKLKKNILILKIISYKKNSNQNNIYQESLKKINLTPINMIVLNKPSERTNSLFNLHFLDLHCKEQNPDYNIMSLDPTSLYIYIYI
jgi:choline kinase